METLQDTLTANMQSGTKWKTVRDARNPVRKTLEQRMDEKVDMFPDRSTYDVISPVVEDLHSVISFKDWDFEDLVRSMLLPGEHIVNLQLRCVALNTPETGLLHDGCHLVLTNQRLITVQLKTSKMFSHTDETFFSGATQADVKFKGLSDRLEEVVDQTTSWRADASWLQWHALVLPQVRDVRLACLDVSSVGLFDIRKRWVYSGTVFLMLIASIVQLSMNQQKSSYERDSTAIVNFTFCLLAVIYYILRAHLPKLWAGWIEPVVLRSGLYILFRKGKWNKAKEDFLSLFLLVLQFLSLIFGAVNLNVPLVYIGLIFSLVLGIFLYSRINRCCVHFFATYVFPGFLCCVRPHKTEASITDEATLIELIETCKEYEVGTVTGRGSRVEIHLLFIVFEERPSAFVQPFPQVCNNHVPARRVIEAIVSPVESINSLLRFTDALQQQCMGPPLAAHTQLPASFLANIPPVVTDAVQS